MMRKGAHITKFEKNEVHGNYIEKYLYIYILRCNTGGYIGAYMTAT
jgi:hypothetical protein